jgi:hypothetical protein
MLDSIVKDIVSSVKDAINQLGKSLEEKLNTKIESVNKRFDSLPVPKDGIDGKDGKSVNVEDLYPHIKHVLSGIELPVGKPMPTADEVAISMKGLFSEWALGFERNAALVLQKAVDNIPKPKDGLDGRDAIELEGLELSIADDERTVIIALKRGDTVIEKSIKLATILDRGVFKDDAKYEKGDAVTFGGCLWIAQKDFPSGKPGVDESWRLSVKRGRDGKTISGKTIDIETVKIK